MAHAVIMPKAGMSMETGTILRWLKSPGDPVRHGEALLEIETDKVAMEVEAEADGVLLAITRVAGEVIGVTEIIGYLGAPGEAVPPAPERAAAPAAGAPTPHAPSAATATPAAGPRRVALRASPLARTIAAQRGLDLALVRGTGPGGAVRVRDLPVEGAAAVAAPGAALTGAARRPLTTMRRAIAARMTRSHDEIPTVTVHADADVTELELLRQRLNAESVPRLSLTPFLLKAAALACREHPLLRSALDGNDLLTFAEVNLGMAVAREGGLIVPVVRRADTLSVGQIAERARELSQKARDGALTLDDVSGAVFTVTNLGMYGVKSFNPLIDPPQSAILGVGAAREGVTVADGQVRVRRLVDVALSFDHRIMDGAEAGIALKSIRESLESPLRLLL